MCALLFLSAQKKDMFGIAMIRNSFNTDAFFFFCVCVSVWFVFVVIAFTPKEVSRLEPTMCPSVHR